VPSSPPWPKVEWTWADDAAAKQEGWALFTTDDGVQLCRLDDPASCPRLDYNDPVFACDEDAWLHVYLNPTPLHTKALAMVLQENPAEHLLIETHVLGPTPPPTA
jgi:hypothetical protein